MGSGPHVLPPILSQSYDTPIALRQNLWCHFTRRGQIHHTHTLAWSKASEFAEGRLFFRKLSSAVPVQVTRLSSWSGGHITSLQNNPWPNIARVVSKKPKDQIISPWAYSQGEKVSPNPGARFTSVVPFSASNVTSRSLCASIGAWRMESWLSRGRFSQFRQHENTML